MLRPVPWGLNFNMATYKRTRFGTFMYNWMMSWGVWVGKHPFVHYLLLFTWDLPVTIVGWIIALCVMMGGHKPEKYHGCAWLLFGDNWGGLSCGNVLFVADNMGAGWTKHTKHHEFGHTCQASILGIFWVFLVAIPSAIRYWTQIFERKHNKVCTPYDAIWFEGSASDIGDAVIGNED